MKKIFSLLMFVLTALLGLTAQAQVVFHTSDAPTKSGWGANTYWYYITLNGKVISSAVGDSNGLKIESSTEKSGEAAMWCVVGNATDGYRFYNKKTGHEKFLGLTNDAGSGSWDNYGASRASMCAATTTHSTTATGTNFVFQLLGSTEYYVKLKDADNRYLNDRGSYISYWSNAAALGNSGSTIKFYAVDFNSEYASALAEAENLISNTNGLEALITPSDQLFYISQEAFTTLRNALDAIAKPTTAEEATTAIEKINAAKATFIASENLPTVGSKVVFKNDYNGFYLSGSGVDVLSAVRYEDRGYLYGLRTKALNSVWILEKGSADKTYKLKNYATGLYVCGYPGSGSFGYTLDSKSGSDYLISRTGSLNGTCAIGGSVDVENWMQCNYGGRTVDFMQVYNGGSSWGAGRWRMTTATEEDLNMSMNLDDIEASGFKALPFITSDAAYIAAKEKFTATPTAENYKVLYRIAKEKLSNAYLRFKSQKSGAKMYNMSCDGNRANSTETDTKEKTDISNIWQLKLSDNGTFKFYNVNHKKWLPALNDASANGGLSPEMKNAENEGAKYTIYYTPTAGFSFIDSNGKWMQVEGDGRINWWSSTQRQCTETTWKFSEAEDITVALNNNEGDGKSYASVYLPFSISSVNDGVKVFVAKEIGTDNVTFTETTHGVKAENGFLLISDNTASTATVNIGESNKESIMSGTLTNLNLTNADKSTYRVFGKNRSNVVGFFAPSDNLNAVKANRGYFKVATGGALRLNFEDSVVSGIDAIVANQALHNAPIFDLSGRRVMNTVKGGLYIQNGRKFIVK